MPSVWSTYLATDDADATARAVMEQRRQPDARAVRRARRRADGGRVRPVRFGVRALGGQDAPRVEHRQPGRRADLERVHDPGLRRREVLLRKVFGHTFDELGDDSFHYATISVEGRVVGGIGELSAEMPPELPSHWMTYFASDDVDATVERATSAGALLRTGPMDTPTDGWRSSRDRRARCSR